MREVLCGADQILWSNLNSVPEYDTGETGTRLSALKFHRQRSSVGGHAINARM
jgi:hypothetical protein